jgi:hypothetical protein
MRFARRTEMALVAPLEPAKGLARAILDRDRIAVIGEFVKNARYWPVASFAAVIEHV